MRILSGLMVVGADFESMNYCLFLLFKILLDNKKGYRKKFSL